MILRRRFERAVATETWRHRPPIPAGALAGSSTGQGPTGSSSRTGTWPAWLRNAPSTHFTRNSEAYIDFKEEEVGSGPGQASSFEVLDIPYLADAAAPDVALMRITGHDLPSVLPLVDKEAAVGNLVALIDIPPVTTGTT